MESAVAVHVCRPTHSATTEAQQLANDAGKARARSVTLTSETDPSRLGGALIRADDLVIDGSVRGRLNKLAGTLTPMTEE